MKKNTYSKLKSINSFKKYFLPRVKIENYNIEMINQLMTQLSNTMKSEKCQ